MILPKRLNNSKFRFCKVLPDDKRAFEKQFNTEENAYKSSSFHLFNEWDGNYGVLCGFGGLFVLDFDDLDTYQQVRDILPNTFTVVSANKRLPHLYYINNDESEVRTMVFDKVSRNANGIPHIGPDGNEFVKRIIDLQGQGKFVVGPNSTIGDKSYDVMNPAPIASVSYAHICSLLRSYFPYVKIAKSNKTLSNLKYGGKVKEYKSGDDLAEKIRRRVSMPQLLSHYGSNVSMSRCECPHNHSSDSGKNVAFTDKLYYCFNCLKGGDVFTLVMEKEGLEFKDALDWFKSEFNI